MKHLAGLLSVFVAIFMFAAMPVYAKVDLPKVEPNKLIYDGVNIIDDAIEKELNQVLLELYNEKGVEFAVITIQNLGGMDIEDYSYQLANGLGIGNKETNTGLLLLVSIDEPKVRIEVGKGLEYVFNDAKAGRYLDDHFVEHRQNGDYTKAVDETVRAMIAEIPDDWEKANNDARNQQLIILWVIIAIIIIVVFCDITFWDMMLLSAIFGGRGSGGGSSGSSGGGFGGFGGGGFGGGGASR